MRAESADFWRVPSMAATTFSALSNERSAESTSIISAIASTFALSRNRCMQTLASRRKRQAVDRASVRSNEAASVDLRTIRNVQRAVRSQQHAAGIVAKRAVLLASKSTVARRRGRAVRTANAKRAVADDG